MLETRRPARVFSTVENDGLESLARCHVGEGLPNLEGRHLAIDDPDRLEGLVGGDLSTALTGLGRGRGRDRENGDRGDGPDQ